MAEASARKGRKRKYSSTSDSLEAKKAQDRQRGCSRINIGETFTEWMTIKDELECKTHAALAKVLLTSFKKQRTSSTPQQGVSQFPSTPGLSGIEEFDESRTLTGSTVPESSTFYTSAASTYAYSMDADTTLSSLQTLWPSSTLDTTDPLGAKAISKGDVTWTPSRAEYSSSDSESEISWAHSEHENSDHEDDDESLDIMTDGDLVFNVSDDEQNTVDNETEGEGEEIRLNSKIPTASSANSVVEEIKCIAFMSCLTTLAETRVPEVCPKLTCQEKVIATHTQKGTALFIIWKCEAGHSVHKWSSQPYLGVKGTNAGDFLLASNILLSGNNYQKIALLHKFMNIGIMSRTTFDKVQREFCFPAIDDLWCQTLETTWERVKEKDKLVLAGDGRNDSPGFSAMYCTYTLMDHETKDIVYMEILDKRMTGGNSPAMEKKALRNSLLVLKEKKVLVAELVTDANASVAAMIRHDFPKIKHQFDLWHGSKNLGKKIQAISKEKGNARLQPWKRKITNHFWACSERSTTELEMKGMWAGVLHHVVNSHEWEDLIESGVNGCTHNPSEEDGREAPWLEPDSKPHQDLRAVVLETRLLNILKYFVNFRHTGFLETFHSHMLMYSSKRFTFTWPSYKARNILAALDWQTHKDRAEKVKKDGQPVFKRRYSKNSNRWTVQKVKVQKTYPHIPILLEDIIQRRMSFRGQIQNAQLQPGDPRQQQKSIAPIPAPSTSSLISDHKSRFDSSTSR